MNEMRRQSGAAHEVRGVGDERDEKTEEDDDEEEEEEVDGGQWAAGG